MGESCGGAPGPCRSAHFPILAGPERSSTLRGNLLLQAGNSACASSSRKVAVSWLIRMSFCCCACSASTFARRASAADSLALGVQAHVEQVNFDRESCAEVVSGKWLSVVVVDAVQQRGVAVVYGRQRQLPGSSHKCSRSPFETSNFDLASALLATRAGVEMGHLP